MSGDQLDHTKDQLAAASSPSQPTGVPNLDLMLGGGMPPGALVIIMGPPGSGKTTLAGQMGFAAAHAGRRVVLVSAISEPTGKLLAHLRTFAFYDDQLVGSTIQFISLEQFIPAGMQTARNELVAIAREARARLVILDGFRGVRGAEADPQAARQFLYQVGSMFSAFGTTTIITSEADPRDPAFFPEATTADIIIGLHYDVMGVQQRRAVEAVKVRGASPLPGLHSITLSHQGLMIYPRLEARVATPLEAPLGPAVTSPHGSEPTEPQPEAGGGTEGVAQTTAQTGDLSFGIPALDQLVGGGLTSGTSTLVMGSLGTGKTLLSLHYALAGAQNGEPALFLSFRETREELLRKAGAFALGDALRAALAPSGPLLVQRWAPVELHPDVVVDRLLAVVDQTGARRLVVDSIAELEGAIERRDTTGRINDFLAALLEALRERGVTALFVREHPTAVGPSLDLATGPLSVLAQNVLLLQQITAQGRLHRVISVVKMRFSAHDTQLHEFTISSPAGIQLLGPFRSTDRGRAP